MITAMDAPNLAIEPALAALRRFSTHSDATRPASVRSIDVFGYPPAGVFLPLNRKTTQNAVGPVPSDRLEPTREFMPVEGLAAYVVRPRRDPADVAHIVMQDGRERWVVSEGHTRLGAARLRQDPAVEARIWEFTQNTSGGFDPVPRGLHRAGSQRIALSYREKLIQLVGMGRGWHREEGHVAGATAGTGDAPSAGSTFQSVAPSAWTAATHDTQVEYKRNGQYTPERAALHETLVSAATAGVSTVDAPVVYFVGGTPGAGKTTLIEAGIIELPSAGLVRANADDMKTQLPEYGKAKAAGNAEASVIVHEESSDLGKAVQARGLAESKSVLVDGVGDSGIEKLEARIAAFRAGGATQVQASYVMISADEAVRRAEIREKETGRAVPSAIIRAAASDLQRTIAAAIDRKLFDTVKVFDNSRGSYGKPEARLVVSVKDGKTTIHDRAAWNTMRKGK